MSRVKFPEIKRFLAKFPEIRKFPENWHFCTVLIISAFTAKSA